MLGNWFEFYADAMSINFWTSTEFIHGAYNDKTKHWSATVRRSNDIERTLSPRHVIFANGVSGIPKVPNLPGLEEFKGDVLHSHSFTDGSGWHGKKALVLARATADTM